MSFASLLLISRAGCAMGHAMSRNKSLQDQSNLAGSKNRKRSTGDEAHQA